jgi:hypothetical protein
MKTEEIINRAAYEIGDESFKYISKDEWLKMLRRVYRDFCEKTKILRNSISFVCTTDRSYKLYGADGTGVIFGDNFLGTYRAEYKGANSLHGHKAFEVDFDTLKLSHGLAFELHDTHFQDDTPIFYMVDYLQQNLWVHFAHTPTPGDKFSLWYYELPRITSLSDFDASPSIDLKYHDKLVEGLIVRGWKRRYIKAIQDEVPSAMIKVFKEEYEETKVDWLTTLQKVENEVMNFKDDTIPLVMQVGTPFLDNYADDTNLEIDETAI